MKFTAIYVALIVAVNFGFAHVPLISIFGEMWPPLSLIVGIILISRDFAQREIGHKVWFAMGVGVVLSYLMADPFVAVASATAFIVAEGFDWAAFTFIKRPMHDRIAISSVVSAPIDSAIFLTVAGFFSPLGWLFMTVSKLVAAGILWEIMRRRA